MVQFVLKHSKSACLEFFVFQGLREISLGGLWGARHYQEWHPQVRALNHVKLKIVTLR
jgi:hypothetical protein